MSRWDGSETVSSSTGGLVFISFSSLMHPWHILQSHFLARGDIYQHKSMRFTNPKFIKEGLWCSQRGVPSVLWQMLLFNGRLAKFFAAIPWVTTAESEKHAMMVGVYFPHVCLTHAFSNWWSLNLAIFYVSPVFEMKHFKIRLFFKLEFKEVV